MANDPTPTPTSDPTPTSPAASDPAPVAAASAADPAPAEPKEGDLEPTALGGGDPPANDPNAADPNAADPADAEPIVPETYELAAPEGFEKLDEQAVAAATPVFKELGLSNEQANKLVPVVAEYAKRIIGERDQQFLGQILEQRKSWLEGAKADPEIGGANWDGSMQAAAKALDQLGFPKGSPLRVSLDESGYGNNPELIRLMARVGKAIGEDTFVRGDMDSAVRPKTAEDVFWPGQSQRKA